MNGIPLESGTNDCHWNVHGKCTNINVTHTKSTIYMGMRDWDSKQNCTVTQLGTNLCSEYMKEENP